MKICIAHCFNGCAQHCSLGTIVRDLGSAGSRLPCVLGAQRLVCRWWWGAFTARAAQRQNWPIRASARMKCAHLHLDFLCASVLALTSRSCPAAASSTSFSHLCLLLARTFWGCFVGGGAVGKTGAAPVRGCRCCSPGVQMAPGRKGTPHLPMPPNNAGGLGPGNVGVSVQKECYNAIVPDNTTCGRYRR